jgi:hypothetical protein
VALIERHVREGTGSGMRRFGLMLAFLTISAMTTARSLAAEIDIPRRKPSEEVSMQKGPPNCMRWTDECVNCTRGADGEAPACSNIGLACQPKAIRCIGAEPKKK